MGNMFSTICEEHGSISRQRKVSRAEGDGDREMVTETVKAEGREESKGRTESSSGLGLSAWIQLCFYPDTQTV